MIPDDAPDHPRGLLIRSARLPLPDGGLSDPTDLRVVGGRIAAVEAGRTEADWVGADGTRLDGTGTGGTRSPLDVLDADGRIALPGLIDAHVHGEAAVFDPEVQLAMLRQGVTSIVVGQDGVSFAPAPTDAEHDALAWATGYFAAINGEHPTFRGGSVGDLLATYERTTPVNVGFLVPHGTLRYAVLGAASRPAEPAEVERMAAILAAALDDGACGLSTGLEYVPAAYADEAELVALARVVGRRGLPHVSHMRGYEDRAGTAFAELVRIARASGVASHVSHYHGPAAELTGYVDDALAGGLDVTFDSYPYLRGCSILSMVALPTWLPVADRDATVAALTDPAVLDRLRAEHFPGLADLWPRVTMASVPGDLAWAEGMSLPDAAARLGVAPADAAVALLVASRLRASCVFAQPPTNSAESVRALANHPAHLGGSDAIYSAGRPHPRGWGAFARFLARVRTDGDWSWHDAQEHLSARAARRFRFDGRGTLRPGSAADVVLVDPDRVRDEATYEEPRRPASGIDDVLVGGVRVLADGILTGATPGRVLRPSAAGGSR